MGVEYNERSISTAFPHVSTSPVPTSPPLLLFPTNWYVYVCTYLPSATKPTPPSSPSTPAKQPKQHSPYPYCLDTTHSKQVCALSYSRPVNHLARRHATAIHSVGMGEQKTRAAEKAKAKVKARARVGVKEKVKAGQGKPRRRKKKSYYHTIPHLTHPRHHFSAVKVSWVYSDGESTCVTWVDGKIDRSFVGLLLSHTRRLLVC